MAEGGYNMRDALDFTLGTAISVIAKIRHQKNQDFIRRAEDVRILAYYSVAAYLGKGSNVKGPDDLWMLPWEDKRTAPKDTKEEAFLWAKRIERKMQKNAAKERSTGKTGVG